MWHESDRLLQAHDAIARRRDPGGSAAIRRDADRSESCCHGHGGAAARSAARALRIPGIARAAEQGRIRQAFGTELRRGRLADQDRALFAQTSDRHCILGRDVFREQQRAEGRFHALGVHQILAGVRNAMEQAHGFSSHDGLLRSLGIAQSLVRAQRDEAIEFRLQPRGALQNRPRHFNGRDLAASNRFAKPHGRPEAQFFGHPGTPLSGAGPMAGAA
jgi:hypothetical protein